MKKDKQKWLDALDRRVIVKNGYPPLHEVKVKEVSKQYTLAPAYNKGAYQVIPLDNIKHIGK